MALRPKTWPPSNALYTAAADYLCIDGGAEEEPPAEPPAARQAAVTVTAAAAAAALLAQHYLTAPSADAAPPPPLAVLCSASEARRERFCRHFGEAGSAAPARPAQDEHEDEPQTCSLDEAREIVLAAARRHLSKQLEAAAATAATTQRRLVCVHRAVHCDGALRGRPASAAEARRCLSSSAEATVVVGVAVADTASGARADGTEVARVALRPTMPRVAIDDALTRRAVLEAAGALAIDDAAVVPFARVEGGADDVAGGLPLALVARLLDRVLRESGGGSGAGVEAEADDELMQAARRAEKSERKKKKKRQKVREYGS